MLFISILVVLLIVDLLLFTVWDRYIISFFLFVATVAGAWWLFPEVQAFIDQQGGWKFAIEVSVAWLIVGCITAVIKWFFFVKKIADRIKDLVNEFNSFSNEKQIKILNDRRRGVVGAEKDVNLPITPAEKRYTFVGWASNYRQLSVYKHDDRTNTPIVQAAALLPNDEIFSDQKKFSDALAPSAKMYVERISFWILQWPFVIIGLLVEDILLKLSEWVSKFIDAMLGRVAKMFVASATKDL